MARNPGHAMILKTCALLLTITFIACSGETPDETAAVDLSPTSWSPDVLQAYLEATGGAMLSDALMSRGLTLQTEGRDGLVASTSGAFAVHAGVEALKRGGTAADAALTVALAHPALHMGGATSYAGQLSMMYYHAATGEVWGLDAGYATVLAEDDPLSIPPYGTPSGRAVLVPGFMAGVAAGHERFGRLPFVEIFEPAIFIAEEGFELSAFMEAYVHQRGYVITRLPSGRALFLDEEGNLPDAGSTIRQPEVAGFLRRIASDGISHMYEGEWAEAFVEAVRAEGGKVTMDDMHRYRASWYELERADIRGFQLYGGKNLQEKLRLAELADLRGMGHYTKSSEALYWLMKISRVNTVIGPHLSGSGVPKAEAEALIPALDLSTEGRYTSEMAERLWAAMQTPEWTALEARADEEQLKHAASIAKLIKDFSIRKPDDDETERSRPDHTAGIAVVDSEGNVASIVHSVTSSVWGELGIFVEGVSVVDPGAFAQQQMAAVEPGDRLMADADPGACPAIVLKNGEPFLACGNVGASFDVVAQQGLVNMLEYRMTIDEAGVQPMFRKNWPPGQPVRQPVGEGEFSREILAAIKAMGIDIEPVEDPAQASHGGLLVVGGNDPATGVKTGTVTAGTHSRISASDTGLVEAY